MVVDDPHQFLQCQDCLAHWLDETILTLINNKGMLCKDSTPIEDN